MNIFVLDRNYNKIGVLSNQGANPTAPYFDDLYVQELDTGADTFTFSTLSTYYTQDIIEIGHHVIFEYNNEHKLFAISSIEFSHKDGFNLIEVYAEGVGFNLLDNYIESLEGSYNYESFLAEVLAGTDWKYVVSGSLANNVQEISYTSEKNIYAVLQDSMQTFLGAELKFVAEYSNGSLTKTIYAYGNGERGSFVGKRFEYGVNVKGITKTLNIANEKDENVIFNEGLVIIDGVEVEISYDVDFALRSFEVEELDIGDTHYVIDNDFDPPLQIKARIGKIEISFSDPTKNKCYLANFKKVTGSKPEDPDGQDVEDMIDDKLEDIGDGLDDRFNDIEERLDKLENPEEDPEDPGEGEPENIGSNNNLIKAPRMHSYEFLLYVNREGNPDFNGPSERMTDYTEVDSATIGAITSEEVYNYLMNEIQIHECSPKILDNLELELNEESYELGGSNFCFRIFPNGPVSYGGLCDMWDSSDYTADCNIPNRVATRIFSDIIDPTTDRPDFEKISDHHCDKHMLDVGSLSCALVSAMQYHVKKGDHLSEEAIEEALTDYTTKEYVDTAVAGMSIDLSDYATKDYVEDTLNQIGLSDYATKTYVNDAIAEIEIPDLTGYATEDYVSTYYTTTEHLQTYYATKTYVDSAIEAIEIPDVSGYATKQSLSDFSNYVNLTYATHAQMNGAIETSETNMKAYVDEAIGTSETDMKAYIDEAIEGIESGDNGSSPTFEDVTVNGDLNVAQGSIICLDIEARSGSIGQFQVGSILPHTYNTTGTIEIMGNINMPDYTITCREVVAQSSDRSLKENIRYIDEPVKTTSDTLLEKADLYDFIVNQIDLCEYNFIGDTSDRIGFIANDYEGTKVGDKIISRRGENDTFTYNANSLLFTTIGALQEEVRIRDEKIASLEDRLAKIEAMLGIDNN